MNEFELYRKHQMSELAEDEAIGIIKDYLHDRDDEALSSRHAMWSEKYRDAGSADTACSEAFRAALEQRLNEYENNQI